MTLKQGAGERKKWGKFKKEDWSSIIAMLSLNKWTNIATKMRYHDTKMVPDVNQGLGTVSLQ